MAHCGKLNSYQGLDVVFILEVHKFGLKCDRSKRRSLAPGQDNYVIANAAAKVRDTGLPLAGAPVMVALPLIQYNQRVYGSSW